MYSGSILDYSWTAEKGNAWNVSGADGTDTLKQIEVLRFDDFALNIDGTNNVVFTQSDTAATDEDTALEGEFAIDVLANDIDFDGDSLTVTGASSDTAGVTVTVNDDNTINYDPGSAFQWGL